MGGLSKAQGLRKEKTGPVLWRPALGDRQSHFVLSSLNYGESSLLQFNVELSTREVLYLHLSYLSVDQQFIR